MGFPEYATLERFSAKQADGDVQAFDILMLRIMNSNLDNITQFLL